MVEEDNGSPIQTGAEEKGDEVLQDDTAPATALTAAAPPGSALLFKRLRTPRPIPTARRLQLVFFALMFSMILLGWLDGSMGPLLPFLQAYYDIDYLLISVTWICNFAGVVISGVAYIHVTDRIGFGLSAPLGALCQSIGYALMASGAPYACFLVGCVFLGFGFGLQEAQINNITSRLPNGSRKMFVVQACFGLGATISPFISTAFAQHVERAYLYFLVSLGLAIFGIAIMVVVFEGRTEEQVVGHLPVESDTKREEEVRPAASIEQPPEDTLHGGETVGETAAIDSGGPHEDQAGVEQLDRQPRQLQIEAPVQIEQTSAQKLKRLARSPALWSLAAYTFLYVGLEVSLGGFLTSYLIDERGASLSAGYVTTGYWGGLTVGRIALGPLTHKLGYRVSIYTFSAIALALELVIWFTHSVVGNAICLSLIGLVLGPIYPAVLMVTTEVLPDDIRGGAMGLIGTSGGAGSAFIPFIIGLIADRYGIWTLQPIAVAMTGLDMILWTCVPRKRP